MRGARHQQPAARALLHRPRPCGGARSAAPAKVVGSGLLVCQYDTLSVWYTMTSYLGAHRTVYPSLVAPVIICKRDNAKAVRSCIFETLMDEGSGLDAEALTPLMGSPPNAVHPDGVASCLAAATCLAGTCPAAHSAIRNQTQIVPGVVLVCP